MPGPNGSLVQRAFAGGELTPAEWARTDLAKHAQALKTARNGFIGRQGSFINRPGTSMIALAANGANKVRLIPFVFSTAVSFALEFGNDYMRVYQAGAQVQSGGNPYQVVSPYATVDLPNIQYVQISNVMYLACAGYPVYKLTCTGATSWMFAVMNFAPTTPPPGPNLESGPVFTDSGEPHLWYGSAWGNWGANYGWNLPWNELDIGEVIVPGQNGFPSGPEILTEYYQITAVDTVTGIESYPMAGTFSNWMCTAHGDIADDTGVPAGDTITRQSVQNASIINSITYAFPMVVTVANGANFSPGDLFTFFNCTVPELSNQTFVSTAVAGNTVTFPVDSTKFPVTAPPLLGVLQSRTSCVTAVPHATNTGNNLVVGGMGQFTSKITVQGNYALTAPDPGGWTADTVAFMNYSFVQGPLTLTWPADGGPSTYVYNVYKKTPAGQWGFMATVVGSAPYSFVDDGTIIPDTSKAPPDYTQIGTGNIGDPSVIGMFQQRLMLGNTEILEDWVFGSNVGNFNQFTTTSPTPVDSDTVQFEVAGQQYNAISQIIDNGFLLIFTDTGEFSCYGSGTSYAAGPLTPTGIGLVQQAFYGASKLLRPLCIGKNVLYLQSQGSKIRELLYNYYVNGYSGSDLTVDSNHLFDGYTFVDWAYQQEPNSIVWLIRNDGTLLSLTYLPELNLKAWTRHDTQGIFESICCIPEGSETAIYVSVNRFNGTRFIERFASRTLPMIPAQKYIGSGIYAGQVKTYTEPDPTSFVFMDCSSFYDGRAATIAPGVTMYPDGGDFTAGGAGFTLQSSIAFFNAGMVGKSIILYSPVDGSSYNCKILAYLGMLDVTCRPDVSLPTNMIQVPLVFWALGVNVITGLAQFPDGTQVSILADGAVVSSPTTEGGMLTVQGGSVTLGAYYAYVRVGLNYFSDMRALDIDSIQPGLTAQDKQQIVEGVALYVQQTRGLYAGQAPPVDDLLDPLDGLYPYKPRTVESLGMPPGTKTGLVMIPVKTKWMYGGGVFVRQPDPLPMTVESIIARGRFMASGG